MCLPRTRAPSSALVTTGRWEEAQLGLPCRAWRSHRSPDTGQQAAIAHRGSLPKLLLLFLRLALVKGMSRDSRRKGRGWGISGAWASGMAELLLSGEPRPGGEL